jgi:hypothetical protein
MDISDLPEPLRKLVLEQIQIIELHAEACGHNHEDPKASWVQVGTLKDEEITRTATMRLKQGELIGESKVLMTKLESIRALLQVVNTEYWEYIVKAHSLPREGIYEIRQSDNAIIMKPKAKKS